MQTGTEENIYKTVSLLEETVQWIVKYPIMQGTILLTRIMQTVNCPMYWGHPLIR